jgi:hypothetical protein
MKDEQDSFPVRHQPSRDVDGMIQVISGDETSASGLWAGEWLACMLGETLNYGS